jgi:hypothetical protein
VSHERPPGTRRDDSRQRHGSVWHRFADGTATVGLVCAGFAWGWQGLWQALSVVVVLAVTVLGSIWCGYDRRTGSRAGRLTLVAGLLMVGAAGLITVLPGPGMLVLLALMATAPPVTARLRLHLGRGADRTGTERTAEDAVEMLPLVVAAGFGGSTPGEDLSALDDDVLCLAWRRSYLMLGRSTSSSDRLAVVMQRQWYLDELHRRSPGGLTAWLDSGGRASGNPLPYLTDHRSQSDPGTEA